MDLCTFKVSEYAHDRVRLSAWSRRIIRILFEGCAKGDTQSNISIIANRMAKALSTKDVIKVEVDMI